MKIGAQYCQSIEYFNASCKKVAEIGYKSVQLSGIGSFKAEEL